MNTIRIGNDITVRWRILFNGQPFHFESGMDLTLLMRTSGTSQEITDYHFSDTEDGLIEFTFFGKDQKVASSYFLTLYENKGKPNQRVVDSCPAFTLVPNTCYISETPDNPNVSVETIEISSSVAGGIPGLSAYELAVAEGFHGTLDEWLESLVGADGKDGKDGIDGLPGKEGRGVKAIVGNPNGSWTILYTDGTSDVVSNEAYQAIIEQKGKPNGFATLDSNGLVTPSQLPGSIKHLVEGTLKNEREFVDKDGNVWNESTSGVESNEFVDTETNIAYLWSGSKFVAVKGDLALGETAETAYAGDKGKKNADDIRDLYATTQVKDLDVEITNTGFGFRSSDSAEEIYAHAIIGGNVKIQINDKKYSLVEYKNRTAYFRHLSVSADKVTEDRIEIYGSDATFKTIEYKAIFDATPLLTSFTEQQPLEDSFIAELDKALGEKKLIYVSGNGTIYLLIGTSRSETKRTFTGVGGNTVYILSFGSNKIVSLDTHSIGAEFRIFNNKEGVNILNIGLESSSQEIKEVFTDSLGEAVLPHTGDVFYIHSNSDVTNSGIVLSMVEDSAEVRMEVEMSNFEDAKHHRIFFKMTYTPSAGLDTIRIVSRVESLIDPAKISSDNMDLLIGAVDKKAERAEINCFNISALKQNKFAGIQEAISALNAYLTDSPKYPGMEVNFVTTGNEVKKYIFVGVNGGGFTSVSNWKEIKISI